MSNKITTTKHTEHVELSPDEAAKRHANATHQSRRTARNHAKVTVISHVSPRRQKHEEEHDNHERWLVSYADFITLLFAFFVVMYAISSVNEGKYRVLSASVEAAFHVAPRSLKPIQVGELIDPVLVPVMTQQELSKVQEPGQPQGQQALNLIANKIEESLMDFLDQDIIDVRLNKLWLEVEIKTSILFPSGSATLEQKSLPILNKLAEILNGFPNPIHVGGFTDDRPINSLIYPSNWELSAGRAASVVHLFNKLGINPQRMAAVGYGEYRSIADNATPEGRNKNRRVVLHILASAEPLQLGSEPE